MARLIEIMWLIIAITSIGVFIYLLIAEGFIAGKAWVYLITTAIATFMYYVRRRQRISRQSENQNAQSYSGLRREE